MADAETFVYRAYGSRARLVYVGISKNYKSRISQMHGKHAAWWNLVERWEVAAYPSRALAEAAEAWAINHEGAIFNLDRHENRVPDALPTPNVVFDYTPNTGKRQPRIRSTTLGIIADHGIERAREIIHPEAWCEPLYEERGDGYALVQG